MTLLAQHRQLEAAFESKRAELIAKLRQWYDEETAPLDPELDTLARKGSGGSVLSGDPGINSKRVLDATFITEEVFGFELPPELIQPGGYDTFEELVSDIVPKLRDVFTGARKVKSSKQKVSV